MNPFKMAGKLSAATGCRVEVDGERLVMSYPCSDPYQNENVYHSFRIVDGMLVGWAPERIMTQLRIRGLAR